MFLVGQMEMYVQHLGAILKYEDLLNDPEQMLSEVIGHLSQAGLNIELNYSLIKSFLNDNPLLEEDKSVVVSNNRNKNPEKR